MLTPPSCVLRGIRLARSAIAQAPDLRPHGKTHQLKLGRTRRRLVSSRGFMHGSESSQRSHSTSQRSGQSKQEPKELEEPDVIPGHWLEFMGVRKWVPDNELQDALDRKAAGLKAKKKLSKAEKKKRQEEAAERRRRRFPPVGGGIEFPIVPESGIREASMFIRGGKEKPKAFTNPLDNNGLIGPADGANGILMPTAK